MFNIYITRNIHKYINIIDHANLKLVSKQWYHSLNSNHQWLIYILNELKQDDQEEQEESSSLSLSFPRVNIKFTIQDDVSCGFKDGYFKQLYINLFGSRYQSRLLFIKLLNSSKEYNEMMMMVQGGGDNNNNNNILLDFYRLQSQRSSIIIDALNTQFYYPLVESKVIVPIKTILFTPRFIEGNQKTIKSLQQSTEVKGLVMLEHDFYSFTTSGTIDGVYQPKDTMSTKNPSSMSTRVRLVIHNPHQRQQPPQTLLSLRFLEMNYSYEFLAFLIHYGFCSCCFQDAPHQNTLIPDKHNILNVYLQFNLLDVFNRSHPVTCLTVLEGRYHNTSQEDFKDNQDDDTYYKIRYGNFLLAKLSRRDIDQAASFIDIPSWQLLEIIGQYDQAIFRDHNFYNCSKNIPRLKQQQDDKDSFNNQPSPSNLSFSPVQPSLYKYLLDFNCKLNTWLLLNENNASKEMKEIYMNLWSNNLIRYIGLKNSTFKSSSSGSGGGSLSGYGNPKRVRCQFVIHPPGQPVDYLVIFVVSTKKLISLTVEHSIPYQTDVLVRETYFDKELAPTEFKLAMEPFNKALVDIFKFQNLSTIDFIKFLLHLSNASSFLKVQSYTSDFVTLAISNNVVIKILFNVSGLNDRIFHAFTRRVSIFVFHLSQLSINFIYLHLEKIEKMQKEEDKDEIQFQFKRLMIASSLGDIDSVYDILNLYCTSRCHHTNNNAQLVLIDQADSSNNGQNRYCTCIKELINRVDQDDQDGMTCLHLASQNHHNQVVKLLLKYVSDINVINNQGQTALHLAMNMDRDICGAENLELIQLLVINGADVSMLDGFGNTPVYYASRNGRIQIIQWLLTNQLNHSINLDVFNNQNINNMSYVVCLQLVHLLQQPL
ncbi:hypothetical protein DFA_07037 [Cavenderia fasciculata]|uniref:Ankyrin repeat-containing protein n=1 Tax=Cavenderia fasciculata TaxID=261658 RepID=F4PVB5_CACFS|nr:uncharacterized protein DFA_07037 [Cavenderia fasciculata]EGG19929.1 hypothetical protein DFA_07037 [Cavenderia fasciculata]|eukprot:XP_004366912.1 hypothetical protein DFA_07037 [Cavenderia fasciculata]